MEFRFLVLLLVFCIGILPQEGNTSKDHYKKRKVVIHIPVQIKEHKHTHTIIKNIHHHHKPFVVKEEKIVKEEVHKPVVYIKEDVQHEHFHHHYEHEHPEIGAKEDHEHGFQLSEHIESSSEEHGGY